MSDHTDAARPKNLTLQNIGEIDSGRVALAFNHNLRLATMDVVDRPGDKSKRKVQLTVEMTPVLDKNTGALDTINNEFVIKTAMPVLRSAAYPMLPDNEGRQTFQPFAPFDPRQSSFSFTDEGETFDKTTGEVIANDDDDLKSDESTM